MIKHQFMVFVLIGVVSAVVDIASMEALIYAGFHYGIGASLGFVVGLAVNYLGHARVTFRAASSSATMLRFGVVVLVNYLITMVFVFFAQRWLGNALVGKISSLPVVAVNGFLWSRYWVFR